MLPLSPSQRSSLTFLYSELRPAFGPYRQSGSYHSTQGSHAGFSPLGPLMPTEYALERLFHPLT